LQASLVVRPIQKSKNICIFIKEKYPCILKVKALKKQLIPRIESTSIIKGYIYEIKQNKIITFPSLGYFFIYMKETIQSNQGHIVRFILVSYYLNAHRVFLDDDIR